VANRDSNSVSIIDGTSPTLILDYKHGLDIVEPSAIAVDPTTHKVYVASHFSNSVSEIDRNLFNISTSFLVFVLGVGINDVATVVEILS
jgi:DNA-binding beta-propeller fold protein YncE